MVCAIVGKSFCSFVIYLYPWTATFLLSLIIPEAELSISQVSVYNTASHQFTISRYTVQNSEPCCPAGSPKGTVSLDVRLQFFTVKHYTGPLENEILGKSLFTMLEILLQGMYSHPVFLPECSFKVSEKVSNVPLSLSCSHSKCPRNYCGHCRSAVNDNADTVFKISHSAYLKKRFNMYRLCPRCH